MAKYRIRKGCSHWHKGVLMSEGEILDIDEFRIQGFRDKLEHMNGGAVQPIDAALPSLPYTKTEEEKEKEKEAEEKIQPAVDAKEASAGTVDSEKEETEKTQKNGEGGDSSALESDSQKKSSLSLQFLPDLKKYNVLRNGIPINNEPLDKQIADALIKK